MTKLKIDGAAKKAGGQRQGSGRKPSWYRDESGKIYVEESVSITINIPGSLRIFLDSLADQQEGTNISDVFTEILSETLPKKTTYAHWKNLSEDKQEMLRKRWARADAKEAG